MKNIEKFKNMNLKDMAIFFESLLKNRCPPNIKRCTAEDGESCVQCFEKWLNDEVK